MVPEGRELGRAAPSQAPGLNVWAGSLLPMTHKVPNQVFHPEAAGSSLCIVALQ